ncbi:MAG: GtrA family protein [Lachnospiraceae bacterium]|nr:GtrA family protein [Lachnospiraceae bacterium]
MLMDLYKKYKEPILYILFGVLTTLVNIVVYYLMADVMLVYYLVSNACAWVASVLFAFVTNKLFVFESKSWKAFIVLPEMGGFFLARIATGVVDMVLMWLLIDVCLLGEMKFALPMTAVTLSGEMFAKILVNVVVIVLNYVASKLWIFRKK